MRLIELGFAVCALAAAVPASAQVYRWVDDRGVVNYAAKPPADGRAALRLDLQEPRVSVIPIAKFRATVPPASQLPPVAPSYPGFVDQATVGAVPPRPDWRTRCIAERRVDCDSPTAATFDVVPSLAQSGAPTPWLWVAP
jgi:hypothetical protein